MAPTIYNWNSELELVRVTEEDVDKVCAHFERGHSNETEHEELMRDIDRKLRPLIGKINERNYKNFTRLVSVVTADQTVEEARRFVAGEDGDKWLHKCLVEKATTMVSRLANATIAPETPLIAVANSDSSVSPDGDVATELRHVNQPIGVSNISLDTMAGTTGLSGTIEPGECAVKLPLLHESSLRNSARSCTSSNVSLASQFYHPNPNLNQSSQRQSGRGIDFWKTLVLYDFFVFCGLLVVSPLVILCALLFAAPLVVLCVLIGVNLLVALCTTFVVFLLVVWYVLVDHMLSTTFL